MKVLAVLTVRNECAFLLEWLAHHRATGVTDFLVFSNDCTDGTDEMLDRLAEKGEIVHQRNEGPYDKGGVQFSALKRADRLNVVRAADWIVALDIDEFINVHAGDHTVPALLAALPDATAITLTWRLFGNAGIVAYEDSPITETFTRCAPVVMHWPWRSAMFKTLFRNDGTYRKLGVHRPRNPDPSRLPAARWFDGQGRELDDQFKIRRLFSNYGRPNYGLVQLNHYPLGAMESFVLKADRGRAVHADHMLGMNYWTDRNFNTDTDDTISALATARTMELARLHADAELNRLHRQGVAWRKTRFGQLMEQEPFRALFARLLMTPPSQPIDAMTARRLRAHAMRGLAGNGSD